MGSVGLLKNSAMVCAPLMAPSVEQLVHGMLQAKAQGADLVEIRLDGINNFQPQKDLQVLLNNNPLPVLIVYRYQGSFVVYFKKNYFPFIFSCYFMNKISCSFCH